MKKKIYYSIRNGGDGSAYPVFFEDELCAELHQELLIEGWGEPCTGFITIEADSLSIECQDVMLRAKFVQELEKEMNQTWTEEEQKVKIKKALKKLKK